MPIFVSKPWGGEFISRHYNLPPEKIGEVFILSTLKGQETHPEHDFPYLVKVIDAAAPLSIQVHPDDHWGKLLENSRGKSECWLVLKALPGAGVYLGLKPGVTEKDLRHALSLNRDVDKLLEFHPVKAGDFVSVPAGAIHAIGPGVTILEVQQSSGITYRFWDWGNTERELHIEKAFQVIDQNLRPGILTNIFENTSPRTLLSHPDFQVTFGSLRNPGWIIDLKTLDVKEASQTQENPFICVS